MAKGRKRHKTRFDHTPGEWVWEFPEGSNGFCNINIKGDPWGKMVAACYSEEKQSIADARLIAAAPDMLAALVGVYRLQCETCPEKAIGCGKKCASESCDSFPFVKVAIEKATGKSIDEILEGGDV